MGDRLALPVTLWGAPIRLAREFKQPGVGICPNTEHRTGLVLHVRFERGQAILRRVSRLPTFCMWEVAISMSALAKAMHGVELVAVGENDLACLQHAAVRALWGLTCISRAQCWSRGTGSHWSYACSGHRPQAHICGRTSGLRLGQGCVLLRLPPPVAEAAPILQQEV